MNCRKKLTSSSIMYFRSIGFLSYCFSVVVDVGGGGGGSGA